MGRGGDEGGSVQKAEIKRDEKSRKENDRNEEMTKIFWGILNSDE